MNTFGGSYYDTANSIKLDSEGNIIVLGKIIKVATFSDGEAIRNTDTNTNQRKQVILKLDGNTGDLLWKTYTGYDPDLNGQWAGGDNEILIKNDGTIISLVNEFNWNADNTVKILEVNSSDGSTNLVGEVPFTAHTYDIEIDNNNNIYMVGLDRRTINGNWVYAGVLTKVDSNYNQEWESTNDGVRGS